MKRKMVILLLMIIPVLAAWLIWPISSDYWAIKISEEALKEKQSFLDTYSNLPKSKDPTSS
jgi:hypothetical protein